MNYDNWELDEDLDEEEFCIIHGYAHMRTDKGPIAYCQACDDEWRT
jgi:hypothetical protein